jgi:hypothetical protein
MACKQATSKLDKLRRTQFLFTTFWSTSFVVPLTNYRTTPSSVLLHSYVRMVRVILLNVQNNTLKQNRKFNRTDWCSAKVLSSYSGGVHFESRLGHRLS